MDGNLVTSKDTFFGSACCQHLMCSFKCRKERAVSCPTTQDIIFANNKLKTRSSIENHRPN